MSGRRRMKLYMAVCLLVGAVSALSWDYDDGGEMSTQLTCNCGWINRQRIVGGQETGVNEYPLVVSLEYNSKHFCGGTILTPWHILTAAHCTEGLNTNGITISVGGHVRNGQSQGRYKVARVIDHEKYDSKSFVNDISLLVTATQIGFNQNVGPVCLPTNRLSLTGQRLKALGWGYTKYNGQFPDKLQEVDLTVIPFEQCQKAWKIGRRPTAATNVCTYEVQKDTCQGDSGGPLVFLDPATNRYTLAALVSYGGDCAGHLPAVNTDVSSYLDWINKNVVASKPGNGVCTTSLKSSPRDLGESRAPLYIRG